MSFELSGGHSPSCMKAGAECLHPTGIVTRTCAVQPLSPGSQVGVGPGPGPRGTWHRAIRAEMPTVPPARPWTGGLGDCGPDLCPGVCPLLLALLTPLCLSLPVSEFRRHQGELFHLDCSTSLQASMSPKSVSTHRPLATPQPRSLSGLSTVVGRSEGSTVQPLSPASLST